MKRDGQNKSLWQTSGNYEPSKVPGLDTFYDVVIVGGGMTGVVTAFRLQQAGKQCLIVDAHNLGFGTTGGTTAHLNTIMDTPYATITKNFSIEASRLIAEGASDVIQFIQEQVEKFEIDCEFKKTSAFMYSQSKEETEQLEEIFKASMDAGLSMEYVSQIPINDKFEKAVTIYGQAKFHPVKYLHAIAQEYEKLGGDILLNCMVDSAEHKDGEVHVSSSQGEIRAKNLVYATHIPPGINLLHLRCAPWRSYAIAVTLESETYPHDLIYDLKDPYYYYRSQVIDGKTYLIAGGEDHKTGEEENTDKSFLKLRAHVESIFKVKQVNFEWSSQYFESADGIPYIGILPGHSEGIYVATGFGGNGMIYSHIAAMEIANKILGNETVFNDLFSPSRVKPVAGFKNFVSHNTDVAKHFIGKIFGVEKLEELAGIAPGEGKVVKFEGHAIAVSKDLHGKVYAVSPVCTHMGCHVAWNSSETSWDCPCHGARYGMSGKVLTGPATENLQTIELTTMVEHQ